MSSFTKAGVFSRVAECLAEQRSSEGVEIVELRLEKQRLEILFSFALLFRAWRRQSLHGEDCSADTAVCVQQDPGLQEEAGSGSEDLKWTKNRSGPDKGRLDWIRGEDIRIQDVGLDSPT